MECPRAAGPECCLDVPPRCAVPFSDTWPWPGGGGGGRSGQVRAPILNLYLRVDTVPLCGLRGIGR